jgi:hypothetical protein
MPPPISEMKRGNKNTISEPSYRLHPKDQSQRPKQQSHPILKKLKPLLKMTQQLKTKEEAAIPIKSEELTEFDNNTDAKPRSAKEEEEPDSNKQMKVE